jgi:2-oxoglutarate ferredoxin oxidoreductase subunit beta
MKAGFVARSLTGEREHPSELIGLAVSHRGFALIDILQPCVSFNKVNTWDWYKERCQPLPLSYDPSDWGQAMDMSNRWGKTIPIGIMYKHERPTVVDRLGKDP